VAIAPLANLPDFPLRFDQPKVATLIGTSRNPISASDRPNMDDLATLPYIHQLEFLVSPGVDP